MARARQGQEGAKAALASRIPTTGKQSLLFSEALGTGALVAVVVGSGIMAEALAQGNAALALLANTLATVFGLYALIEVLSLRGFAHFNPIVSALALVRGEFGPSMFLGIVAAQLAGAVLGCFLAHAMFELELLQWSTKVRAGPGQWIAEATATAGLVVVVLCAPEARVAPVVAAYIGAAYWFTASTSFANPAVAVGRMFSDSFAGIAPASVPGFVLAEIAGGAIGLVLARLLGFRSVPESEAPVPLSSSGSDSFNSKGGS